MVGSQSGKPYARSKPRKATRKGAAPGMTVIATRRGAAKLEKTEDYDLKKSKMSIGPLYPVLTDSKGRIIDGMHRLVADKDWPKYIVNSINDERSLLIARIVANVQRREVQPEEKRTMLKELADETNWTPDQIAEHTGMSANWVRKYLDKEHKNARMSKLASRKHEMIKTGKNPEKSEHTCRCGARMKLVYCCPSCGEMEEAH
jgi:hypothetical protein